MNDYGYEQHVADLHEIKQQDRELRFQVLDSAVFVELEFLSAAAFYLGGGSATKQDLVECLIGEWGGMKAATKIIKKALSLHGYADSQTKILFDRVEFLRDLRHNLAHGTTESWQANPPETRHGRLGRELRTRTRSGQVQTVWIDFQEAESTVSAGRDAARALSRLVCQIGS